MPNQRNIKTLEIVNEKFNRAKSIFFTNYKGLNVQQMNELRKELYKSQIDYQVVKKTLIKIAARQHGIEITDEIMEGQTGLAFGYDDPTLPGKILQTFIKKNNLDKLSITGCIFEGAVFNKSQAEKIINLPSKQELYATLLGVLQSPMSNLVGVLQATMSKLIGTLESLKEKKNQ